jgi:hypothetical protein
MEVVDKPDLEMLSFHESSRVVLAYLKGYTCKSIHFLNESMSVALIDYGEENTLAASLMGSASIDYFTQLEWHEKLQVIEVAGRLAQVFVAGSVGRAVYRNQGNPYVNLPLEIDPLDLYKVQYLGSVLTAIDPQYSENFVEDAIRDVLYTLQKPCIWEAINLLGKTLFRYRYLSQPEIEDCLKQACVVDIKGALIRENVE